jgi:hypothetical protein
MTCSPTALINEAYLRLVDWKNIQWSDRAHFFGIAANMPKPSTSPWQPSAVIGASPEPGCFES